MMFSSNTFCFILALVAACNALTSATVTPAVNLGTAKNYVILTKTGISTVPYSVTTGIIGVSPILATAMTGFSFSLTMDSGLEYSKSGQITGKAYAADYAETHSGDFDHSGQRHGDRLYRLRGVP
jgi:hypothetical protein